MCFKHTSRGSNILLNRCKIEDETEFLDEQVNLLEDLLKRHGETHVSDLQKPVKLSFLRSEGGDGYTKRYFPELWGKVPTAFTSDSPIAELQDRVFGLSLQTNNVYSNQLKVATAIDSLKAQIDQLDKRILAVAYAEASEF